MINWKTAIKFFILMTLLTGLIYPLVITGLAQLFMPKKANGSLVIKEETIIGSALIAQNMAEDRYFWPRPSATDYDPLKPSGGSNLGPTSQVLKQIIEERKQKVGQNAPADLLYASGSGLDPHIRLEGAYFQIPRVAKARGISEEQVRKIVDSFAETFWKKRYVNVLALNLALDGMQ